MTEENWNTFILGVLPILSIAVTGAFAILTLWVKGQIDANAKAQLETAKEVIQATKENLAVIEEVKKDVNSNYSRMEAKLTDRDRDVKEGLATILRLTEQVAKAEAKQQVISPAPVVGRPVEEPVIVAQVDPKDTADKIVDEIATRDMHVKAEGDVNVAKEKPDA